MSWDKICKALYTPLIDNLSEWAIAWENTTIAHANKWLSVHLLPADESVLTLGTGGVDRAEGLMQITLHYPAGQGEGDSRSVIDSLRACYLPGTLEFEGQTVRVLSRYRSTGRTVAEWYSVPFTVRWQADIPRL